MNHPDTGSYNTIRWFTHFGRNVQVDAGLASPAWDPKLGAHNGEDAVRHLKKRVCGSILRPGGWLMDIPASKGPILRHP